MVYPHLSLSLVGLLVGLLLVISHAIGFAHAGGVKAFLTSFPRAKFLGQALFTLAALWFFLLTAYMDLGEYTGFKPKILMVTVVAYGLVLKFAQDYLAVRALGILLLLAAEPILESAFLQPQTSRLFLVTLAYVWVTAALFWVGMPWLMRDQINWLVKKDGAYKLLCGAGLSYGVVLVILSLTQYR
ncbi:MAG: hypothetical protein QM796_14700 [Chthoniobacteraceae bacterium]